MFGFGKKSDMEKMTKEMKKVNRNLRKMTKEYDKINRTLIASTEQLLAQVK